MNYKKRNIIGTLSFIVIIFLMLNFNFILKTLNQKILGIDYIGVKGEELYLYDLQEDVLTKNEIIDYIIYNLKQMDLRKNEKYDFSIYVKNIEEEDKFVEVFRIPIDKEFNTSINKSIDLIKMNEKLLVKFVIYHKDDTYISKIFNIKLVDEIYKNEGRIVLQLDEFSKKGTYSLLSVPKYVNLGNNLKFSISGKHNDLDINDLKVSYDSENQKLKIENLVPYKQYSYIEISTKNAEGIDVIMNVKNLMTSPEGELQEYISKIYVNTLNRNAYEQEFFDALDKISSNKTTISQFLTEFISKEEFDLVNDTPKKIIESIYFLCKKQKMDVRVSTLILDEVTPLLLDDQKKQETKINLLNKFLSDQDTISYMESKLKVKIH